MDKITYINKLLKKYESIVCPHCNDISYFSNKYNHWCDKCINENDELEFKKKNSPEWKLFKRLTRISKYYNNNNELWSQWYNENIIDTMEENSEKIKRLVEDWNTHNFNKGHYFSCLCGHNPLRYLILMKNLLNNERCIVGTCCIDKFKKKGAAKLRKKIMINLKIMKGTKKGYKYCEYCKNKIKDNDDWKSNHKTCFMKYNHLNNIINNLEFIEDNDDEEI